ncbi:MAG: HesA/MoeB/ThiF family protein [Acidiferrobacterales bacterium]|nr:HesA/MoeB/ThiF family protein [Acidiferrobacterales bacterium]
MDNDIFVERYSRQIKLPHVGLDGQRAIANAKVLIVGMGGLGSPVSMYLAAAGVGFLGIADFDVVDRSNLQRQIVHRENHIGLLKTESAASTLREINKDITIERYDFTLEPEELSELARQYDLIVDCTDNFPTRFQLNDATLAAKKPLVSGAAIRWEGQVAAFDPRDPASPCYECLYSDRSVEAASCAAEGVISPLVGIIGTMQALESVNILLGRAQLVGAMWLFDAHYMEWQKMVLPKNPKCSACGNAIIGE